MNTVPEPRQLGRLWLLLLLGLVLVVVLCAFVPAESKVGGACVLEPSARWTLAEIRPGSFESRAVDLAADRMIHYRLYQFDRSSFMDLQLPGLHEDDVVFGEEGQVVARISDSSLELALAEKKRELNEARAVLASLMGAAKAEEIDRAEVNRSLAEAELETCRERYRRQQSLFEDGITSRDDWEEARGDYRVKQLNLELAEAELMVLTTGARPEEIATARVAVQGLENELAALESMNEAQEIRCPVSGRLSLGGETGMIMSAAVLDSMVVRILLPQQLGAFPQVGQTYHAHVPGAGEVEGRVIRVDRRALQTGAGTYLTVLGLADNPHGILEEGMQGRAEIRCGKSNLLQCLAGDLLRGLGLAEGPADAVTPESAGEGGH